MTDDVTATDLYRIAMRTSVCIRDIHVTQPEPFRFCVLVKTIQGLEPNDRMAVISDVQANINDYIPPAIAVEVRSSR